MAKLAVDIDDFHEGNLPHVCIVCGAKSRTQVERKFTVKTTWMILLNYLPLNRYIFSLRNITGKVPLCQQHKKRFTLSRRLIFVAVATIVSLAVLAVLAGMQGGQAAMLLAIGCVVLILPFLALLPPTLLYLDLSLPRLVQLDSGLATLDSVAEKFAQQVVAESPAGLETTAQQLPAKPGMPKLVFGLALGLLFGPATIGIGIAAYHFNQGRKIAQRNAQPQPIAEQTTKPVAAMPDKTQEPIPATELEQDDTPADKTAEKAAPEADIAANNPVVSGDGVMPDSVGDPKTDEVMPRLSGEPEPELEPEPTVEESSVKPAKQDPDDTPESVANAIELIKKHRDRERRLQILTWLESQHVDQADQEPLIECLKPLLGEPELRTAALKSLLGLLDDKHVDVLQESIKRTGRDDEATEYLTMAYAKLRDLGDTTAIPLLIADLNTGAKDVAVEELKKWGPKATPEVLKLIHVRDDQVRQAAADLIDQSDVDPVVVMKQSLQDLDNRDLDRKSVLQRLNDGEIIPSLRVEVGRRVAKWILDGEDDRDLAVDVLKRYACSEHIPDITELLESKDGKVIDAGRSLAIHLRDPALFSAVVKLIDVPFGDKPTAEACRKIGPPIQKELWPYLSIPQRVGLVVDVLRDIGTTESIRPLTRVANSNDRLRDQVAEAIAIIKKEGKARAKQARDDEVARLAQADVVAKSLRGESEQQPMPESVTGRATESNIASKPVVRVWTDQSGKFKRKGEFVSKTESVVSIRIDGKVVDIPIAKLSPADQDYLDSLE